MSAEKSLTRREFTVASALAALSGVAITISSACGGGGGSSYSPSTPSPTPTPTPAPASTPTPAPTATPAPVGDKVGAISSNHGHSAVITGAQLTAGGAIRLNIQGSATHSHTVDLSGAEIASIAGGTKVAKESSTDSEHNHTVTFN
jgi:hypothetical protein